MKNRTVIRYAGLATAMLGLSAAQAMEPDELFRRVSPSVMMVKAYDAKDATLAIGSAVLIAPENLLTNCHVLAKARRIEIKQDNVSYGAELVHIDIERDLCQIRARNFKSKPVEIGNSDKVSVGKKVYALGNPRGLELTLSDGLISALRKDDDGTLRFIQTTAPISPGSSGGALFDSDAKLIGITSMARVDSQNLNFAIPINMMHELAQRSRAALAREAADRKAAVTTVAATEKRTGGPEEKLLLGSDLRAHFNAARSVSATTSDDEGEFKVEFVSQPGGSISITNNSKFGSQIGTWSMKDENQVCFNFGSRGYYGGARSFRSFMGCYRLFSRGGKKYALRSAQDGTYFLYADEQAAAAKD